MISTMEENLVTMIKGKKWKYKDGRRCVVSAIVVTTPISDKDLAGTFTEWVKNASGIAKSEHKFFHNNSYYGKENGVIGKIAIYFYYKEVDENITSYEATIYLRNRKEVGEEDKTYDIDIDLE